MVIYKNTLSTIFLPILLSFVLQGCWADKDPASEKAEAQRLKKEKIHEKHEEAAPDKYTLAKENGYQGYIEYKSIEKFTKEYEYKRLDINDYRNYIISNKTGGTYAYTFSRVLDDIEIYKPNKKYGWTFALGIKRHKGQTNKLQRGGPLLDTKTVRFLGVSDYKTVYGIYQKILLFDRAENFRAALVQNKN